MTTANPPLGRVLIVDDETKLATALRNTLAEHGYEAAAFNSARDALDALQTQEFDLLLTDLMMPAMDGIALLQTALEVDPHLVGIIMTGQGTIPTAVDAMKVGAFDYVLKPFTLSALLPTLVRAMDVRRLRMENVQLRETTAIYELSMTVAFTLDVRTILNKVAEAAMQQCNASEASVMLPTPDGQELYLAVVRGEDRNRILGHRLPMDRGVAGWVLQHKQPLMLHGEVNDPRFAPVRPRPDIRSAISMPMMAGGNLMGVLNVNAVQRRAFTLGDMKALNILTSIAASALENARLYEVLKQEARLLETKVDDRTRELQAANAQLQEAMRLVQEASRHKSEFLANMSHELRTPLNSILGFSQLLLEQTPGLLSEKQLRFLTNIHNSGQHLLQLISDILDISKVEAGKFVLQPEGLPVAETLEDILVIARGLANKKGQVAEVRIEPNLPPVHADPVRFKQILFNLLSNAVKFTPDGGLITLTARRISGRERIGEPEKRGNGEVSAPIPRFPDAPILREGDSLEIAVRDTGVGIREEDLPRLFGEFVQPETTQAQHHEGTGLGLALTKKLVELHGGQIWAESQGEGRGSSFTILLPFAGPEN